MQQPLRYVLVPKYLSEIPHPVPQHDLPRAGAVKSPGSLAPWYYQQGEALKCANCFCSQTFAALLATTGLAGAQGDSFFNNRFCAMAHGGDTTTGIADCSFYTWDQCIASSRGVGRWCTTNPDWHEPRQQMR